MAVKVNQVVPSEPTNKITAGVAAAGVMSLLYYVLQAMLPNLPNDQLIVGLTPFAVGIAGWFIRDRPNQVVPDA